MAPFKTKRAALVITTYNEPNPLGLCLLSLSVQTSSDFDIYIADDGSSDETRHKIESMRRFFSGITVQHVWHPDSGYTKPKINNEVFRQLADYPVTICIDGDTFVHPRFVEDHIRQHGVERRLLFMGRRVDLGPEITRTVNDGNVLDIARGLSLPLFLSGLKRDTPTAFRALRIESPTLRRIFGRDDVPDLLGSNFSISTALLYEVNGYDETSTAYWGEDGDLYIRVRNSGAVICGSKSLAIQYHLHHPRRVPSPENQAIYRERLRDRTYVRCRDGIVKGN